MDNLIEQTLQHLPEFLSSQHLIDLGIYLSVDAAYYARLKGPTPPYIRLKHKILYPKKGLIKWLQQRSAKI